MATKYEHHAAARAFPMMDRARFTDLKTDIEIHGQHEPITLCGGKILDGRNRYKACLELGVKPHTRLYQGDPWSYVWSLNGQRRDLSEDHRAQIWIYVEKHSDRWIAEREKNSAAANAKRSKAAKGRDRDEAGKLKASGSTKCPTTGPASEREKTKYAKSAAAGVNAGAIARAEALERRRPDLAEKVRSGEVKPAEARRQAKRDEVANKAKTLPAGKHTVIYADPPWSYNDKQGGSISENYGAAEKHYPAMTLSELKVLGVPAVSAPDSVLFLWATSPLLPDALELAKAWGFTYKSSFVWDKVKHNMGHYNSVRHEFLLVCTRGSCTPQVTKLFDSVQTIERSAKHSEKPKEFRRIIETLYPKGGKLELFARSSADGWKAWGNEC